MAEDHESAHEKSLAPIVACEYAIQACEALSEAHARGIIHRDIKPSNLFVAERAPGWRAIKVLDFGVSKMSLAQSSNITTNLNVVMGTPCYMSPEQIQSAAGVDHRTDIWSLGATLYQMLTGRAPFDPGLPILALAEEIAGKELPRVSDLCPEVPLALSQVVARCLARDRDQRIASAAELAAALVPFAPVRSHLVAERAATLASALGAVRTITPSTPVPSGLPEIEAADDEAAGETVNSAPGAGGVSTPPFLPRTMASDDVVTPPGGSVTAPRPPAGPDVAVRPPAGDQVATPPGGSASAPRAASSAASTGGGPAASTGGGQAAGEVDVDVDVRVFVDMDTSDITAIGFAGPSPPPRPIASPTATPRPIASPTATPRPIAWSEPEPASASAPSPEPDSLALWQVTTGLLPADRDAAHEQGWQAAVESWLTPRNIGVLAIGSVLLCVFAFLILPRLVGHRPVVAVVAPVQGAEAPPVPLTAIEAMAPSANALVVYVSPPTAQIVVDGVLVRGNPYRAQFPRGGIHLVKAFAPGYEPRVEQAHMSGDVVINLSLERSARFSARSPTFGRPPRATRATVTSVPRLAVGGGVERNLAPPASPSTVDPHGGRAPLHPIVTVSPYDSK